jgi:hypothetical protein
MTIYEQYEKELAYIRREHKIALKIAIAKVRDWLKFEQEECPHQDKITGIMVVTGTHIEFCNECGKVFFE